MQPRRPIISDPNQTDLWLTDQPVSAPPAQTESGAEKVTIPPARPLRDTPTADRSPGPKSNPAEAGRRRGQKRARIVFEAPVRLKRKLERVAQELDRSKTGLLREALEKFLRQSTTPGGSE